MAAVLVTGGLGYIGSHAVVALAQAGHEVVIVDNLSNSRLSVLERLFEIAGGEISFQRADLRDRDALEQTFREKPFQAVLHFAGLKSVGESVEKPAEYQDNNVGGSKVLFEAMARHRVARIVFSSSATVYGDPAYLPLDEKHRLRPANPYGENKVAIEKLLRDSKLQYAALRYFNPLGAHPSGRIGEHPQGVPNNLLPYATQVAVGKRERLRVWGNDYDTVDGTGVRDYLHVTDLVEAHLAALRYLEAGKPPITCNLGTGRGYSVLEVVKALEKASGKSIPYDIKPRRAGDVAASYADPRLAARELGWRARLDLDEMCRDAWRWQSMNPDGYV